MSATSSPVEPRLPQRSGTVSSTMTGFTRRTSMSDEEAIPGSDSNETTNLLLERLRAWKHMCGYLEDYVSVTAKVSKSQAKDFEKVLKTVSDPLREGHHFSQSAGGVAGWFENIRANTQGMVNLYTDSEKNLKGSVLPPLERLHKEIKAKSKELQNGAAKGAKAVEKARGVTQKHIELLAQHTATLDAASHNKLETSHDPYVLRRGVVHRLNKQVIEENNNRQDLIVVQNNFQQFEAHVLQTVQAAMEQFVTYMGGQLDRHRAMYTDMLSVGQRVPPEFEWVNFMTRNDSVLVNPDAPPRSLANITFPNQDHRYTQPLIEGTLERKSRAMLKGYSPGHYVVTHARYLHEFKDTDDLRRDPTPELSLFLPDCIIGAMDGSKFSVKGKDVSGGKVGNAFHTNTELNFKAANSNEAEKWWTVIKDATRAPQHTSPVASSPISPVAAEANQPPAYAEKESAAAAGAAQEAPSPVSPPAVSRTNTSGTAASLPSVSGSAAATSPTVEKTAEKA
ncbi:PH domain protein, partial [Aspergillus heteromorphus CBS 117.55]